MAAATSAMCETRIVPADAGGIAEAVALLGAGGIVALPTETVYGLGADAGNAAAVAAVFAAKGRPAVNPLIVHVADIDMAGCYADLPPAARRLAAAFWPGPLTLVVAARAQAPLAAAVTAGLDTVALRVPAHPVMAAVLHDFGRGVAAPSANASGRLSPTRASHVLESLGGRIPLIVDAGPTTAGLESSIVAVDTDGRLTLLRHGAIPLEAIRAVAGADIAVAGEGSPVAAPGMLLRHYAPRLPLRLGVEIAGADAFHIGFGPIAGDASLSPAGDLAQAAARLFELLHIAEASGRRWIAVAPIPDVAEGRAILDRLRRAARG